MPPLVVGQSATLRLQQRGQTQIRRALDAALDGWAADDFSWSQYGDVFAVDRGDQRAVALDPLAFPANLRDRVGRAICDAEQARVFCKAQRNAAAQHERAGCVVAGGNQNLAAAQHRTAVDGLLQGERVDGFAVSGGVEILYVERNPWHRFRWSGHGSYVGSGRGTCGRANQGRSRTGKKQTPRSEHENNLDCDGGTFQSMLWCKELAMRAEMRGRLRYH